MTPIEHYWPPEMLAATFPDRFGHLASKAATPPDGRATMATPYTVEAVTGGCEVIRPSFGLKASKGKRRV